MSTLSSRRGRDVDRGVGDDERLLVGRHVEHEAVAEAARGAQPGVALHHLTEQLVGVQAALHQRLGAAAGDLLHRLRGGGVAVGRLHQLAAREVQLELLGDGFDLRARADQDRPDQPQLRGVDGAGQRGGVARVGDRGRDRRQLLGRVDQALVLLVVRRRHAAFARSRSRRVAFVRRCAHRCPHAVEPEDVRDPVKAFALFGGQLAARAHHRPRRVQAAPALVHVGRQLGQRRERARLVERERVHLALDRRLQRRQRRPALRRHLLDHLAKQVERTLVGGIARVSHIDDEPRPGIQQRPLLDECPRSRSA